MPTQTKQKYFLTPAGTEFVLQDSNSRPIQTVASVGSAVDYLLALPDARGSVLVVFNSFGRPELQLNL